MMYYQFGLACRCTLRLSWLCLVVYGAVPATAQDSLAVRSGKSDSLLVESGSDSPAALDMAFADSLAARRASLPDNLLGQLQDVDLRLFYRVYLINEPTFKRFVLASDATSYPMFYGSVPAALAAAAVTGDGGDAVYRLALSEALAYAASDQIKRIAERIRPVRHIDFLPIKNRGDRTTVEGVKSYGFPSGHSAVAAALVTSWSLSYPEWYIIAPGAVWVAGVGLSRIWRGRHYPGDVAAGIVLGAASAWLIHEIGPHVTPTLLKDERSGPAVFLRLVLP